MRFAGVIEYAVYDVGVRTTGSTAGGTGWQGWGSARIGLVHGSRVVFPGRNRTNGHLVTGRLLVKDQC